MLGVSEGDEETVGDELDVLAHELSVHTKESARKGFREELAFDINGLSDDVKDSLL